jgi:predicted lipid-binding transport protein (Tim44 family)
MYQIIEVIILAAIAFLVISNLISSVGTVEEDDPALNQKSRKNGGTIKDVTNTLKNAEQEGFNKNKNFNYEEIKKYFSESLTKDEISNINSILSSSDIGMSPEKFLNGAKSAFKMIIEEVRNTNNIDNNNEVLSNLIDKRYINQFIDSISSRNYKNIDLQNIKCLISDSYSFSRSLFVNVSFFLNNDLSVEEWTLQKSPHNSSNIWVLSNITTATNTSK